MLEIWGYITYSRAHETNLSAEEAKACQGARLPFTNDDHRRPQGLEPPSYKRTQAPLSFRLSDAKEKPPLGRRDTECTLPSPSAWRFFLCVDIGIAYRKCTVCVRGIEKSSHESGDSQSHTTPMPGSAQEKCASHAARRVPVSCKEGRSQGDISRACARYRDAVARSPWRSVSRGGTPRQ